jgi:hypothetical protein
VSQSGNNLVITDARPDIQGQYIAYVYTSQGQVQKTLTIIVTESGSEEQPISPYIVSPNPRTIELDIGEQFVLECTAKGVPTPSIRIQTPEVRRKSDKDVQIADTLKSREPQGSPQAKFEISYFTEDNAGTYLCVAENSLGQQVFEEFIVRAKQRDQRQGPPTIRVDQKRIEAFEGSSTSVSFAHTGSEPVQIKVELYSAQRQPNANVHVDKERGRIEIKSVSKDLQGQYLVEATNDYGTASDYFELVVIEGKL